MEQTRPHLVAPMRLPRVPRRTLVPALGLLAAGIAGCVWLWQFRNADPPSPPELPSLPTPAHVPAHAGPADRVWTWPEGVPGFRPFEIDWVSGTIIDPVTRKPDPVSRVLNGSQVSMLDVGDLYASASRKGLHDLRIVAAERAPLADGANVPFGVGAGRDRAGGTCLSTWTPAQIDWHCPGDPALADSPGLVVGFARSSRFADGSVRSHLVFAGVARGDVYRVDVLSDGQAPLTVYVRGLTWGEIAGAYGVERTDWRSSRLEFYDARGALLAAMPFDVPEGTPTVLRPAG